MRSYSSPDLLFCTCSPKPLPLTTLSTTFVPGRTMVGGRWVRGGRRAAAAVRAFCCKSMLPVSIIRIAASRREAASYLLHDDQSGHGLDDGHGAGHDTRVVAALGGEHTRRAVVASRWLFLRDGRWGFEANAMYQQTIRLPFAWC